jgi:uracil-DNA glycosylase
MPRKTSAIPARPRQLRLNAARRDADGCRRCDLWESATQTVFGTGPIDADLMLVGEQPGDQEDKAGQPFVGPAGRILDQALQAAGLGGVKRYVTNAVKHFKWEPRGKRRIHLRPNPAQMLACQYWLDQEVEFVKPKLLVALGATAVRALLGNAARVMRDRGRAFSSRYNADVLVTVHPSSILRAPDAEAAFAVRVAPPANHRSGRHRSACCTRSCMADQVASHDSPFRKSSTRARHSASGACSARSRQATNSAGSSAICTNARSPYGCTTSRIDVETTGRPAARYYGVFVGLM